MYDYEEEQIEKLEEQIEKLEEKNKELRELCEKLLEKAMKLCASLKPADLKQTADILETFDALGDTVRFGMKRLRELSA